MGRRGGKGVRRVERNFEALGGGGRLFWDKAWATGGGEHLGGDPLAKPPRKHMSGLWEQLLTVHGLEVAKQGWDGALGKYSMCGTKKSERKEEGIKESERVWDRALPAARVGQRVAVGKDAGTQ